MVRWTEKYFSFFVFPVLKILYVGYTVVGVVRGENSVMPLFVRALSGRS
jgi:hypothetical protein